MSKRLQKELKRLQKEGILDSILKSLSKQINKMADKEFAKVRKKYDKDTRDLMDKIRKDNERLRKMGMV